MTTSPKTWTIENWHEHHIRDDKGRWKCWRHREPRISRGTGERFQNFAWLPKHTHKERA